jgi:hypothetical protein
MTTGEEVRELIEACKRIFLAGHSEGWTGNQQRRDVQHIDAEKGWSLYVENGALRKALAHLLCEARLVIRKTGGGDAILNED